MVKIDSKIIIYLRCVLDTLSGTVANAISFGGYFQAQAATMVNKPATKKKSSSKVTLKITFDSKSLNKQVIFLKLANITSKIVVFNNDVFVNC